RRAGARPERRRPDRLLRSTARRRPRPHARRRALREVLPEPGALLRYGPRLRYADGLPRSMTRRWLPAGLAALAIVAASLAGCTSRDGASEEALPPNSSSSNGGAYDWGLPADVPRPLVPADNPMTQAKVALGRRLFYD